MRALVLLHIQGGYSVTKVSSDVLTAGQESRLPSRYGEGNSHRSAEKDSSGLDDPVFKLPQGTVFLFSI